MVRAQIKLDTFKENNISMLKIPQGDYLGRELNVTVTSLGQKILLDAADGIVITASRPDGASKSFEGRVDALSGTAVVPISRWMLDIAGDVECWVSVVRGESKYTTNSFLIEVQSVPEYISSEDGDYTPSDQVIVEINARISALDGKLSTQENKLSTQENKLSAQEDKLSTQENKLSAQEDKLSTQENKLSAQEDKLSTQENKLSAQEDKLSTQENKLSNLERTIELLQARVSGGVARILNIEIQGDTDIAQGKSVVELPFGTTIIKCSGRGSAYYTLCFVVLDINNIVIKKLILTQDDSSNNDIYVPLDIFNIEGAAKCAVSGINNNVGDEYMAGNAFECSLTIECR